MKHQIRVDGKLLVYHMKNRKDSSASLWAGPYLLEVKSGSHVDDLRSQFGSRSAGSSERLVIAAPMPGLVNRVEVSVGARVSQGDPIIVLEAMKMENVIRAGIGGTVTKLTATPGKSVEKGEELVTIQASAVEPEQP
jgi:biotin carboxyl carrier protein